MAKFEIGCESQGLSHSNITPRLEHHHRDWATRKCITDNQLRDNIETNLLIRDSLDHSNRNNVEEGNHKGKDEPLTVIDCQIDSLILCCSGLHREFGFPDFDGNDTKYEHDD